MMRRYTVMREMGGYVHVRTSVFVHLVKTDGLSVGGGEYRQRESVPQFGNPATKEDPNKGIQNQRIET